MLLGFKKGDEICLTWVGSWEVGAHQDPACPPVLPSSGLPGQMDALAQHGAGDVPSEPCTSVLTGESVRSRDSPTTAIFGIRPGCRSGSARAPWQPPLPWEAQRGDSLQLGEGGKDQACVRGCKGARGLLSFGCASPGVALVQTGGLGAFGPMSLQTLLLVARPCRAGLERVSACREASLSPNMLPGIAVALGAFPAVEVGGWLEQQTAGACSPPQTGFIPRQHGMNGASEVCTEAQGERRWPVMGCERLPLGLRQELPVPLAGQGKDCRPSAPLHGQKAQHRCWLPFPNCRGSASAFVAAQLPREAGALSSEVFRLGWTWPGPAWPRVGNSPAWSPFPPAPRRCCEGDPGLASYRCCIPAHSSQHLLCPYGGPPPARERDTPTIPRLRERGAGPYVLPG